MTPRAAVVVVALLAACRRNAAPPPGATVVSGDAAAAGRAHARVGKVTGVWADFTPPEGGVTVSAPGLPLGNTWTQDFGGGAVTELEYFLATDDYAIAYAIAVTVYPPGGLRGIPRERLLELAATHALAIDVATRRDTPSSVGDLPALDVTATSTQGVTVRVRVVAGVSVDRIYTISVSTRPEKTGAPEVERFLASMRVQ